MPNYLVTGASGQLGQCFQSVAKEFSDINLYFATLTKVDITQSESLVNFYNKNSFDGIINCAAYTAVDKAEKEPKNAFRINTEAIQNLIDFAETRNLLIINFSTDYVFDGESSVPYREESITNPIGVYGKSKLEGEILLSKGSSKNVTIRTSWLFSPFGKNFVKTIALLAKEKKELTVVDDQWGRPTNGIDLARSILKLISKNIMYTFPILHFANQGMCSWKEFAEAIVHELEFKTIIKGIPASDYPTLAKRPKYSILDTRKIEKELHIEIPKWQDSLRKCIQILKSDGSL